MNKTELLEELDRLELLSLNKAQEYASSGNTKIASFWSGKAEAFDDVVDLIREAEDG